MLKIKPPANDANAPAKWIPNTDPAWDKDRIRAEKVKLGDREAEHPVVVYYSGATHYDLDAQITIPEPIRSPDGPASATVGAWLTGDPTIFTLKSLGAMDWEIATGDSEKIWFELCRRGIQDVCNIDGVDGAPVEHLPRDRDGKTSEAWLDALSRSDRNLIPELGLAIYRQSLYQGASAEGKP